MKEMPADLENEMALVQKKWKMLHSCLFSHSKFWNME